MRLIACAPLLVAALIGTRGTWAGPPTSRPTGGARHEVVKVATAEEFVAAIGPDRVIQLAAGEYVLTDVKDGRAEFTRWERVFDGKSLTIRGVKNLSVVGVGEKPVRIIVRPRYAFVLNFEKCQDVTLSNLTLGHEPKKGFCDKGVVGASECVGLTIRNCDLFGCGTEGLTLEKVSTFRFENSVIRDCTYGIMTIDGCKDLAFTRSRFVGNRDLLGARISDSRDVIFDDCTMEKNRIRYALFELTSTTNVQFNGGAIRENRADALSRPADGVAVKGAAVEKNRFEAEKEQ